MESPASPKGYLCLVLHSHMPYVREAGRRSSYGEEMLHEAVVETYIPLLNVLYGLRGEGIPFRLTISCSPLLAEQLADEDVANRVEHFLSEELLRAQDDVQRFEKAMRRAGRDSPAGHFRYLARFYVEWYQNLLLSFRDRFNRDLLGALGQLQEEGWVEIITSAATHAYLPLMERASTVYAQLRTGMTSYLRSFGRLPRGVWLPECGYRPAYRFLSAGHSVFRPGLEDFLAELNLRYTFSDGHAIAHRPPPGRAGSGIAGPYGLPGATDPGTPPDDRESPPLRSTFRPYWIHASNVAVFGRDEQTARQVWSPQGYAGDPVYREFYRRDEQSGLQYWRITGDGVSSAEKDLYDPYNAFHRVQEHAAHFVGLVRGLLRGYHERAGRPGVIVAAYNTELFGHWWFEGSAWIREVLAGLSEDGEVQPITAGEYLERHPPEEAIELAESSWGRGGNHSMWSNAATEWMWPLIHGAERRMEELVVRFPDAEGQRLEVLKQAARELLLLQSSDWPFLVSTQQAPDYAAGRFRGHLERFNRLAEMASQEALGAEEQLFLQECQHIDNPFLNIDYRAFAPRE